MIREVRGAGLLVGVQLTVDPGPLVERARDEGVLVVPAADHVVRFLPPLTVRTPTLCEAVRRFGRALTRHHREARS